MVSPAEMKEKVQNAQERLVTPNLNRSNEKPLKSGTGDLNSGQKRKVRRKCSESMRPLYTG